MSVIRLVSALAVVAALAGGCAAKKDVMPVGTADADKYLFDKGPEAAKALALSLEENDPARR